MSGLICWCGDGLHVENETPFCDSCGTVYSCVEQAKVASAKTIERYNLFLQSMTDELKLTDQAKTIAALEREVEVLNTKISSVRSTLNHWNKFRPDLFAEPEFTDLMMVIFDEQEALAGKNQKEEFEAKNPLKEEFPLPPGKTLAGGEAG